VPSLRLLRPQVRRSLDGRVLTMAAQPVPLPPERFRQYLFSRWDAVTGRFERWGGNIDRDLNLALLSPDGRFAITQDALFSTGDGSRLPLSGESILSPGKYVFSPDGRLLAGGRTNGVRIWEVATGKTLLNLPEATMHHATFSADGRHFAFGFLYSVQVWDVRTGKRVLFLTVPENQDEFLGGSCTDIAFSADGRMLATGHAEGTILLWPMAPPSKKMPLEASNLAGLWEDLAQP